MQAQNRSNDDSEGSADLELEQFELKSLYFYTGLLSYSGWNSSLWIVAVPLHEYKICLHVKI